MYHRDMARPLGSVELDGSGQLVWTTAQVASGSVNYPVGAWRGSLRFEAGTEPDQFLVEIGSSSNGTDFTASGAQALAGGSDQNAFQTNAVAVSVPSGHHLAVRLTNNSAYAQKLIVGGVMCYISSTGEGDPEWPGGATDVDATPRPRVSLRQNYPNPFNPETTIEFSVPERGFATLDVFDVIGHHVATLLSETVAPGVQRARWDGRDQRGNAVASGLYFYQLSIGGETVTKKMVLLR
jgi:hypothetical protein